MDKKYSLNPVLFGIVVIALPSVLVVTAISQLALAFVAGGGGGSPYLDLANQSSTNATGVQFLAIQTAQSGSLSQINAKAYTLELGNVSNTTILFSDRPERIVETVSTANFIGNWSDGPDSFAADAPNDVLVVENIKSSNLETTIIESFNPVYDTSTNTLTYTITVENGTSMNMPSQFGQSILVADMQPQLN